jgi:hypothetical protein
MSESHTEPHASGQEPRGRTPVWEWTTDEQAEVQELRASLAELETEMERIRVYATDARARENETRRALRRLAEAKPWERRSVVAELAGRGLL